MIPVMKGYALAIFAGVCGSVASMTGKLIGYQRLFIETCDYLSLHEKTSDGFCWYLASFFQIIFACLTVILSSVMWTVFVESMQYLGSSEALMINTGSNIFASAAFGWLIFNEKLTFLWWVGAAFILCGLSILTSSPTTSSKKEN